MIRLKTSLLGCCLMFLSACATTHPGKMGEKISNNSDLDLTISGRVVDTYSDKAHQFIDFTFENKKTNWERVKSIEFQYGEGKDLTYNVIVGEDLVTWANAYASKKAIEDHNTGIALSSLMLAGSAIVLSKPKSKSAKVAGGTALLTGAGGALVYAINEELRNVETSKMVPKTHIYSEFAVPAGLFVRKWVLVNVPGDSWPRFSYLTVNTIDGKTEKYKVPIN